MEASTTAGQGVSSEWIDEFVERWLAAWNSREPERLLELMTDDIVWDDSGWPQTMRGHGEAREYLDFLWGAFPDFTVEAVGGPLVASDGPRAAFWWRAHGTNLGPLGDIPASGKRLEWEGADFEVYRDGKVARLSIVFDMSDALRQLGAPADADGAGDGTDGLR